MLLPREEGGGFFQDLPLLLEGADPAAELTDLLALFCSESVFRPPSMSAWLTQRLSDSLEIPRSLATSRMDRPEFLYSRTASARNSGGYPGLPTMWTPFQGPHAPHCRVSTEPGQDQGVQDSNL